MSDKLCGLYVCLGGERGERERGGGKGRGRGKAGEGGGRGRGVPDLHAAVHI